MPINRYLVGDVYGRLTLTALPKGGKVQCRCSCGNVANVAAGNLRNGRTKSCGCLNSELSSARRKTHGMSRHPAYRVWNQMVMRCTNPETDSYPQYGGRGIFVCSQWRAFPSFWEDMGRGYAKGLTIDRKDVEGSYSPENCRWATTGEQARNTRRNRYIETPNGRMLLCDAAAASGIPMKGLHGRLKRGWTPDKLFNPRRTCITKPTYQS